MSNSTANATVAVAAPHVLKAAVPASDIGVQTFVSDSVTALAGGW